MGLLTGLTAQAADRSTAATLAGVPSVTDRVRLGEGAASLTLTRDVRAFFQGNRFLLETLAQYVAGQVPEGPVVDLYAGVGLFGLAHAAAGKGAATLVEGDAVSSADLARNATPYEARTRVERRSVEAFLRATLPAPEATAIVDPPRTGLSKEAREGLVALRPRRVVYVSCDAPTLARDARALIDAGYALETVTGLDLFPNTAHVECVAVFISDL